LDDRFRLKLISSPAYAIDPTVPEFEGTPGMKKIISEQQKERLQQRKQREENTPINKKQAKSSTQFKDPQLAELVNKVTQKDQFKTKLNFASPQKKQKIK